MTDSKTQILLSLVYDPNCIMERGVDYIPVVKIEGNDIEDMIKELREYVDNFIDDVIEQNDSIYALVDHEDLHLLDKDK